MPDSESEWHREVLPPGWERAVADLTARGVLEGFYLAGGTGLALQIGHRRSIDLDLFRPREFAPGDLRQRLGEIDGLQIRQSVRGTLHLELHKILVSLLHYPYPLLFPLRKFEILSVADPRDIACMKLDAIASRGSRRDFVDLYMMAKSHSLREMLDWAGRKYAGAPYNRVHLLKALTYFVDAEQQPMPDMLVPLEWSAVTAFFTSQIPPLSS